MAVLTADEIRQIPLFSSLPAEDLERLAQSAADVQLAPGEFAVHEGGERALYAVVSGKIEVIKLIDGVERTIGWRAPGTIFGEVPIAFGTPFQGAYRASQPSRVMRVEARQYFAAASASPELSIRLGALARERIGGLQSLAATPPQPVATLLGKRWDPACNELRRFLARNQITFDWVPSDSPDLAKLWSGPLPADDECPVLRLADGRVVSQPTRSEVARLVGLQTSPRLREYDTVIVGGGPAGLAAAVYGASEGLSTLVLEAEAPGGQAGTSSRIENYLGFPNGVSGDELASRALQQARRLGAEIVVTRTVTRVDPATRELFLDGGDIVRAKTIILATGVSWRRLEIEGADRLIGKGVYYGASRTETSATQGRDVHLVGAGNSAGQAAMYFANHARKVTLVVRGDSLDKSMSRYLIEQLRGKANIEVRLRTEVAATIGETHLTAIDLACGSAKERCESGGLFIFIGADAATGWLPAEIACDDRGYVRTGDDVKKANRWSEDRDPYLLESSVPGVFACGDVRLSPIKRVASAVGEGSMAIAFVHQYLAHLGPAVPRSL